jgi:hypothetical protein
VRSISKVIFNFSSPLHRTGRSLQIIFIVTSVTDQNAPNQTVTLKLGNGKGNC